MRSNSKTELFPIYVDKDENRYIVDVAEDGRYSGIRMDNGFRYLGYLSEVSNTGERISLSPIVKFVVFNSWMIKMIVFSLVILLRDH